ncbi:MAG TPA: peptidoglycan DD-metalloendopeptidase family protein [Gammaproteobacteria bacterium]
MDLISARYKVLRSVLYAALVAALFLLVACSTGLHWNSQLYRVRANETLYAIAWRYNLDYRDLARWNNISPPYTIRPGEELILSDPALLPESRRPQSPAAASPAGGKNNQRPRNESADTKPALPPPKKWLWPTRGKVVRAFQGPQSISQGIDIAGMYGQDVRASADGRIVYSGSGLAGFGQLIIIKHNDTYISAYAHNSKLLVKEGEEVRSGQKIAEMGKLQGAPRLHFEIRRQGKPVDPSKYLPAP